LNLVVIDPGGSVILGEQHCGLLHNISKAPIDGIELPLVHRVGLVPEDERRSEQVCLIRLPGNVADQLLALYLL